jgi:hypothetical protein
LFTDSLLTTGPKPDRWTSAVGLDACANPEIDQWRDFDQMAKSVVVAGGNGYRLAEIAAPNAHDLLAQQ